MMFPKLDVLKNSLGLVKMMLANDAEMTRALHKSYVRNNHTINGRVCQIMWLYVPYARSFDMISANLVYVGGPYCPKGSFSKRSIDGLRALTFHYIKYATASLSTQKATLLLLHN